MNTTTNTKANTTKQKMNAPTNAFTNEIIIAILTKAFNELQDHESRITTLEQLKEASVASIDNAANQLIIKKPEDDVDIVMSFNLLQFRDWMRDADDYHWYKTGKHIRSAYLKIYSMLDNSGIPVISDAMNEIRNTYDPIHAPNKTLYKLIFNDQILKGVFVSALLKEIEKL